MQVKNGAELLFSEVQNALSNLVEQKSSVLLNSGVKVPEARHQMTDLEEMLQKEKAEFEVQVFLANVEVCIHKFVYYVIEWINQDSFLWNWDPYS